MTAKPRGARRTLTITHPDNTTSTRTTAADYLYGVERGPVDSERWARHLEMRAIEHDKQADNAETLLKEGFKTLRRHRGIGDDHRYNDFELIVETNARTTPDIGESVHTYCNYDRQSSDYVRDADGNPVRDADGQWTEIVRPGVDILREYLERLAVRRREYAAWLREQIAAGPSEEERSYTVLRWSKSDTLAAKAAHGAEFAHHRAAGHPLTVVKVDQAHEGHERGVYISPAERQSQRRAATIAAVNATVLTVPAADEGVVEQPTPDDGRPVAAVDMTDRRSGIVLVTGTGRAQSPQAHVSVDGGVWSLDSEYTDNDGTVEPIRLTGSALPYVVGAFVQHLGLDPWNTDYRFEGAAVYWNTAVADAERVEVSPSALAAAVMTWNSDRTMTAARWNFNSVRNFAARLFGQFAAVVEIDEAVNAYKVTVRDVLTGTAVKRERATGDDVLNTADRLLRQARRDS